jgi:alpha-tubulin suppressor-like RCC1 family protein
MIRRSIARVLSGSLAVASFSAPVVHAGVTDVSNLKFMHSSVTLPALPTSQKLWALDYTTCVTSNDVVRCWGSGRSPVFGLPTSEMVSDYLTPITLRFSIAGLADLDAYVSEACGVFNGSVKCWGDGSNGVAGNGERGFFRSPLDVNGLSGGVSSVVVNNVHACAVKSGSLLCWGYLNPFTNQTFTKIPTVVPGLESGVELIAGTRGSHYCVLVNAGVKCAGSNLSGALGDGSNQSSHGKFVDVVSLAAGSGVTALDAVSATTCAIANAGVKCWGRGSSGQLGNSDTKDSSVPVDVFGLGPGSGATDISTGRGHTCAIVNSGIQCWGENIYGQLGNGTTKSSSVPVQVLGIGPGSGATDVVVGASHTCAIVRGDVFCWGSSGELGDGSGKSSTQPIGVSGLSKSAAMSVTTIPKKPPTFFMVNAKPSFTKNGGQNAPSGRCNDLTGADWARLACIVVATSDDRELLASFLRIYIGSLEKSVKDPVFSRQLESVYADLANPDIPQKCVSAIKELVILDAIRHEKKAFNAKKLYEAWTVLYRALELYNYATAITELGLLRGLTLKYFIIDRFPSLESVTAQWGGFAAEKAFEFGNNNAQRVIGEKMYLLGNNQCPGRYDRDKS